MQQRTFTLGGVRYYAIPHTIQDELERLRAEVEALRVDAERYRWLRENVVHCELVGWKTTGSLKAMDEVIDASLAVRYHEK